MRKNISGGIIMILLAVIIVGSGMGMIPNIPWFKILCTLFFVSVAIKGLIRREFFSSIMSLCVLGWMYDDMLGIQAITPFPLFFAGVLLAIGLGMIFRKDTIHISYEDGIEWTTSPSGRTQSEGWQDGRHVFLENNFNSVSKYVNAQAFSTAKLENNFGAANIYFNNAVMANNEATVRLENNFGQMNVYLPDTWRASVKQASTFGKVNLYGEPNRDMDAPLVMIHAESNFGELNIYFS